MEKIITNHTHAIKDFLREYGIENIISVKHSHDFIFEALTSDGKIEIITEPVDADEKQIKILSVQVCPRKQGLSVEEQELLVYVAKYNSAKVNRFLNTDLCKKQYSLEDIECFKGIISPNITNHSSLNLYWDLDTAAREYFIEILNKVFCATLLR